MVCTHIKRKSSARLVIQTEHRSLSSISIFHLSVLSLDAWEDFPKWLCMQTVVCSHYWGVLSFCWWWKQNGLKSIYWASLSGGGHPLFSSSKCLLVAIKRFHLSAGLLNKFLYNMRKFQQCKHLRTSWQNHAYFVQLRMTCKSLSPSCISSGELSVFHPVSFHELRSKVEWRSFRKSSLCRGDSKFLSSLYFLS